MPKRRNNVPKDVGLKVTVRTGDFTGALRKFKKKVSQDGILMEFKAKRYFEKPSEKRKRAKAQARARHLKEMSRREKELGF